MPNEFNEAIAEYQKELEKLQQSVERLQSVIITLTTYLRALAVKNLWVLPDTDLENWEG